MNYHKLYGLVLSIFELQNNFNYTTFFPGIRLDRGGIICQGERRYKYKEGQQLPTLGVNIDHIATIRQARRTVEPDP
ncbi:MAG: pyridoxine 5'-phosphate synthase, partial [Planktothrix sp.]